MRTISIYWLIVLFAIFVAGQAEARKIWPASLTVQYQGQPVRLSFEKLQQDEPVYSHPAMGNAGLRLSHRVLFRHDKSLNFNQLDALKGRRVARVFELESVYWSVVLTQGAADSLSLVESLRHADGVTLAEPDFLQVRLHRNREPVFSPSVQAKAVRTQLSLTHWPAQAGAGMRVAVIDAAFSLSDPTLQPMSVLFHYDVDHRRELPLNAKALAAFQFDTLHGDGDLAMIWSRHPDFTGLAPDASAILLRRDKNWTSDILIALQLAFLKEADLIQAAWTLPFTQQALTDALLMLKAQGRHGKGLVVVAAAGNQSQNLDANFALAAQPQVLAVNAVSAGTQWPATGRNLATAVEVPYQVYSSATQTYSLAYSNTSAATAATTGVLAAVLSVQPTLTAAQLHHLVRQFSQPVLDAQSLMQHVQRTQNQNVRL
ncbi:S8 family serine peptidase [Photobacterium sp. 53610]|uniref:S8 family serine peptidase n=1 Tax=Photobacterium sp. 53610 TaxID=3102789 RepID=UPI002EDA9A0B